MIEKQIIKTLAQIRMAIEGGDAYSAKCAIDELISKLKDANN
jgi:hypothetical protein